MKDDMYDKINRGETSHKDAIKFRFMQLAMLVLLIAFFILLEVK